MAPFNKDIERRRFNALAEREDQSLQNNNAPHKTKIAFSGQPDQEWMVCFFNHWKEATKNLCSKPQILLNGKQMLIISRSDFALPFIIPAVQCMGKANREQQLQIKVVSEVVEAYKKGIAVNHL